MTRIIAGTYGGRRLRTPPGDGTRPTTDRVREALFSSLESAHGGLEGVAFLDLFAGSGAIGLEAASRGAARVDLVEQDARAAKVVSDNVRELGASAAHVHRAPVERFVAGSPPTAYDIVFLDPPYALDAAALDAVLVALPARGWLADDATVVVERSHRDRFSWPEPFAAWRDKAYGETHLWYGR